MRFRRISELFIALSIMAGQALFAQATFQNLGFEDVQNIPVFDPRGHPWLMPASDALPGWTCYVGTNPVSQASYNDVALDSAWVGVLSNTSSFAPLGLVVGQYCASLQYGVTESFPSFTYGTASIAQLGQVPSGDHSILFRGTVPFVVTFDDAVIPLSVLSNEGDFYVYGGDVSQYAGKTGELKITTYSHFSYIDDIQFSSQPVPEPAVGGLIVLSLGLCGIRRKLECFSQRQDRVPTS